MIETKLPENVSDLPVEAIKVFERRVTFFDRDPQGFWNELLSALLRQQSNGGNEDGIHD